MVVFGDLKDLTLACWFLTLWIISSLVLPFDDQHLPLQSELEYLSFMYMNPGDFAELRKRVEDIFKAHEQELEEVLFWYCTIMFLHVAAMMFLDYFEIFQFQANRILKEKIAQDQFLDLVSVETEVRSVCKEVYR